MGSQRRQPEAVVEGDLGFAEQQLFGGVLAFGVALPDHLEQPVEGITDVGALFVFFAAELGGVHLPQAFKAVAQAVDIAAHRRIAQVWPALDVEEEQQPVHVPEAFERQLIGVGFAFEHAFALLFAPVDRLVADQLDRLAQGVLEITTHLIGVLVAVLIQFIEIGGAAIAWAGVLSVQQGCRGQQRIRVVVPQQRVELKAQQP